MNTWNMEFKKSIKTWDEGLPLGDGKLGSLVYGSGPIRISLDRIDLWDNRPTDRSLEPGFTYKNLIKLAFDSCFFYGIVSESIHL